MADDLDDIRAYDRARERAGEKPEFVPAALVDRLIAGENRVKVWREYRGLTQQALTDRTGISKPYLSQIENGAPTPSLKVAKALAKGLGLEVDEVV